MSRTLSQFFSAWTPEDIRRHNERVSGKVKPWMEVPFVAGQKTELKIVSGSKTKPKRTRGMNKLESAYAALLTARQRAREMARWDYEPVKLRLADATFYTPDFRVVTLTGHHEFHETKGAHVWDDALVKLKVAAEMHPYEFFLCTRPKGQGWSIKRVGNKT